MIVHETDTGYAQCFREDAYNARMGEIDLSRVTFSDAIVEEWDDEELFNKIKLKQTIVNPKDV